MVNHGRTLLANMGVLPEGQLSYGEEYIPVDFFPVKLPGYMDRIRDRLFGRSPDRTMVNYRVRQMFACVTAAGMSSYAKMLDSRTTYDLYDNQFIDNPAQISSTQNTGSASWTLRIIPSVDDMVKDSRLVDGWSVVMTSSTEVVITRLIPSYEQKTVTLTYSGVASQQILLPGSSTVITIGPGETFTDAPSWTVNALYTPRVSFKDAVESIREMAGDDVAKLFSGPYPLTLLNNVWNISPSFFHSATAALALALIHKTEQIRSG